MVIREERDTRQLLAGRYSAGPHRRHTPDRAGRHRRRDATAIIATATVALLTERPTNSDADRLVALARGRGLLARGTVIP